MAVIGDILYLKCGSQPLVVVQPEHGDSKMVTLMSAPGVAVEIPIDALTATDPRPAIAKASADIAAQLNG